MKPWPALASLGKVLRPGDDGETLFYYDTGGGITGGAKKPAVVLIHGLGDEADSWRHLIPRLHAAGYRVLAPDLPGFGRSAAPGRISLGGHTAAALRLLGLCADRENPAALVGNSMGALIAENAARGRPDLVGSLVLMDACFPPASVNAGLLLMALPMTGKRWYRAFRTNPEGAYQSLVGYYADLERMPEADRRFLRERVIARVQSDTQERAYFASLRSLIMANLTALRPVSRAMAAFPGRILLLWGETDRIIPAASADRFRALRPDAGFVVIPGAGHLPQQEKPAETAREILSFLEAGGGL
jgi:pimeloyl-ACP methyl ester carboxylesterase